MTSLVAWVEIPTLDFQRAIVFYNALFGFDLQVIDCGESEKMACFPGGEGAVIFAPGYQPSEGGLLVSFQISNMEQALEQIKKNGGSIVQPKTKIEVEGRGYFAVFIDCEGNKVGLYSND